MLRIGDTITVRTGFGLSDPTEILVTGLEITERPREKEGGEKVIAAPWERVRQNRVVVSYGENRWAYSEQVVIPKLYYCCPECGCTDIQQSAWVYVNTNTPTDDEGPTDGFFCPICEIEEGEGHTNRLEETVTVKPFKEMVA
jgi:hypothetical protein